VAVVLVLVLVLVLAVLFQVNQGAH